MRGSDSGGRNVLLLFRKWTKQLEVKLLLQPAISDSCVSIILTAAWARQGERLLPLALHPPAWGLLEVDAHLALSRACWSSCKTGRGPRRVISSAWDGWEGVFRCSRAQLRVWGALQKPLATRGLEVHRETDIETPAWAELCGWGGRIFQPLSSRQLEDAEKERSFVN